MKLAKNKYLKKKKKKKKLFKPVCMLHSTIQGRRT